MSVKDKLLNGLGLSHLVEKIKSLVKANPTLAGTEDPLTGLEVDGTKFKVPETTIGGVGGAITLGTGLTMTGSELSASGGSDQHLYWHSVALYASDLRVYCIILNTTASEITKDGLKTLIGTNMNSVKIIAASGILTYNQVSYDPAYVTASPTSSLKFAVVYYTAPSTSAYIEGTWSNVTVTDAVNQIF